MVSKYTIYWIDEKGNQQGCRNISELQEALYTFLYLSRKHDKVVMKKNY